MFRLLKRGKTQSSQEYNNSMADTMNSIANDSMSGSSNSLTASTISLLGQQQRQQQHPHEHPQHPEQFYAARQYANVGNSPLLLAHDNSTTTTTTTTKLASANQRKLLLPLATMSHNDMSSGNSSSCGSTFKTKLLTHSKSKSWTTMPKQGTRTIENPEFSTNKHVGVGVINQRNSISCMRRPPLWQKHRQPAVNSQKQQQHQHQQHQQQQQQSKDSLLVTTHERENLLSKKQMKSKRYWTVKVKDFIIEFLQGSSIHGFIYLAKIGLSFVERMLWFAFICIALFSIISLSQRTWQRFQTSPMVISMDRNKLVWNTSFPSLTVCPHKRIDELKVEEYMDTHPEHFGTEELKEYFRDFIVKLASLSYDNIEILPLNNSFGIPSDKYLDILYELKWHFEPEISSGAAVNIYIYETQTEFGRCHSVNSIVARYNSYEYWRSKEWNLLEHGDRVTVHPLDGEIYAQIINLSTSYDVYFHGAGDVPSISKQRYTFPETDYTTVELIALEIYTNEEARAFTTKQRKCRFQYEAEDMLTVPIYSFGLCLSECRMFFALKVCGCIPHFYRRHLRNGRILPVCDLRGIGCLQKIKSEIISLKSDKYKINCNCLANCDDSNFFVQSYRSRVWFLGANLQWGIIDYPKMQLRRDVLFSFADVLVYIGGLVGFFLGCSALSFTEIIYYFTARFVKRMFCN